MKNINGQRSEKKFFVLSLEKSEFNLVCENLSFRSFLFVNRQNSNRKGKNTIAINDASDTRTSEDDSESTYNKISI